MGDIKGIYFLSVFIGLKFWSKLEYVIYWFGINNFKSFVEVLMFLEIYVS